MRRQLQRRQRQHCGIDARLLRSHSGRAAMSLSACSTVSRSWGVRTSCSLILLPIWLNRQSFPQCESSDVSLECLQALHE